MKTVKAFVEIGSDGGYSVYVDLEDNTLNYGIHGTGSTAIEAMEDFQVCYADMKKLYQEMDKPFVEAKFEYHYDVASFLNFYTTYFSLAGLSRLTGIHQGQLSHYVNGTRSPSKQTVQRIDSSIHSFAKNLSQVHFI